MLNLNKNKLKVFLCFEFALCRFYDYNIIIKKEAKGKAKMERTAGNKIMKTVTVGLMAALVFVGNYLSHTQRTIGDKNTSGQFHVPSGGTAVLRKYGRNC